MVPINKTGDKDEPEDYRPISIFPVVSKMLEKVIAFHLTKHLEDNNLLSKSKHGFLSKLSIETALMSVTNKLYDNIDLQKISLVTLCQLFKAFDIISHEILISKMRKIKYYLSPHARTIAINSLVLSSINYASKKLGYTNTTQLIRVQKVVNFAAKVALDGAAKRDHVIPFLKSSDG